MRRYSIMAIRVHGKDQLVVQFRVPAPLEINPLNKGFFYFLPKSATVFC